MGILRKLIDRARGEVDEGKAQQSQAWHTFEGENGDRLRIYNMTTGDIPLVMSVSGRNFRHIPPFTGTHEPRPLFNTGDYVYRLLTQHERTILVNERLQFLLKECRKHNVQPKPKHVLRNQLHVKYARTAAVFQVQDVEKDTGADDKRPGQHVQKKFSAGGCWERFSLLITPAP